MSAALLSIYLNDHLLGASAGVDLFRRAAAGTRGTPTGDELERLTAEVVEDRASLREVMQAVGAPARTYKVVAGWALEKAGRLKPNGHLLRRSPLSTLVELEALRVGVQAKEAGWLALREVAAAHPGLSASVLDRLVERARRQGEVLERLRLTAAGEVLGR